MIYRTRGTQDEWDAGQVGCRPRWKQDRMSAGKERWRKEGMKGMRGQRKGMEGFRTGGRHKKRDSGLERCRTRWIQKKMGSRWE